MTVSWTAATDNVGVTGYRLLRCTGSGCTPSTQVATPNGTSYTDVGLSGATTYTYRVSAVDAAGNVSAASSSVSGTTPSGSGGGGSGIPPTTGWYTLPNTTIDAVCASRNGFEQVGQVQGCFGILSWSGGAFDSKRNRLIVTGGGHNAYYGNELYALNLDTQTMTRLNDPGLPIGSYSTCQEAIAGGTQPNSRHTYDGIEYMPNVDRLYVFSGSLACGLGSWGQVTWTFDFATMRWQRMDPSGPAPRGEAGMMTAYDPNTGRVYLHDRLHLYAYDFTTNTYTRISTQSEVLGYHMMATIDPKRRQFIIMGYDSEAGGGRVYAYDIGPSATGRMVRWTTTGATAMVSETYPGLEYDPVRDRVVAWNGGNSVYSLDLDTRQWTAVTASGGPGAPSASGSGTHGRWRYSPASDVFVLVNEYNQNGRTFRMP